MKIKNLTSVLVVLIMLTVLALVTYYVRTQALNSAQNEAKRTLFSQDENAEFLDAQSNPISLDVYTNKILVVNVWASWSPYSAIEFPILNETAALFKDKGVHFLLMNRKENQAQIDRFLSTIPNYENLERITDVNDFFYSGIEGYAMPETVIYNTKGKIIKHIRGLVTREELELTLNELLNS